MKGHGQVGGNIKSHLAVEGTQWLLAYIYGWCDLPAPALSYCCGEWGDGSHQSRRDKKWMENSIQADGS